MSAQIIAFPGARIPDCAIREHDLARDAVRRAVELDRLAERQAALAQMRQEQERAGKPIK